MLKKTIVLFFTVALFLCFTTRSFAQSACTQGVLNIVAHEDDDLLFLSPDLLHDIQNNRCSTTVFVTAGDGNKGQSYWKSRENGVKAAYAQMAGAANSWRQSDAGIRNHPISVFRLRSNSAIALVFMRLPDGNWDGSGFSGNNNESLKKLWQGSIQTIKPLDGAAAYTKSELVSTLLSFMSSVRPGHIRTQNYIDSYNGADHSDHYTTAYATFVAHESYTRQHTLSGYAGYTTSGMPQNIFGSDLTNKQNAFFAYGGHDTEVCNSLPSCQNNVYGEWLQRQYVVGTVGNQPSPIPTSSTPTPTPATTPSVTPMLTINPTISPSQTPSSTPTPTTAGRVRPTRPPIPTPPF